MGNFAVQNAYHHCHFEIAYLLYDSIFVRDTLKNDDIDLYNILRKKFIKNKISEF